MTHCYIMGNGWGIHYPATRQAPPYGYLILMVYIIGTRPETEARDQSTRDSGHAGDEDPVSSSPSEAVRWGPWLAGHEVISWPTRPG